MLPHAFNASTWGAKAPQVELCEFNTSLVFRVSYRTTSKSTEKSCLKKTKKRDKHLTQQTQGRRLMHTSNVLKNQQGKKQTNRVRANSLTSEELGCPSSDFQWKSPLYSGLQHRLICISGFRHRVHPNISFPSSYMETSFFRTFWPPKPLQGYLHISQQSP